MMKRQEILNGLENALEHIIETSDRIGVKPDGTALYEEHIEFMLDAIEEAMKPSDITTLQLRNVNDKVVDQINIKKTPEVIRVIEWFNRVTLFDDSGYFKILED